MVCRLPNKANTRTGTVLGINFQEKQTAEGLHLLLHVLGSHILLMTSQCGRLPWKALYYNSQTTGLPRLVVHHNDKRDLGRKKTRVSYLVQQECCRFWLNVARQDPEDCVSSSMYPRSSVYALSG